MARVLAITVFGLLTLGLLVVPTAIAQDAAGGPPDVTKLGFCLTPGNNAERAAARVSCDDMAQGSGYDHGVLIPCEAPITDTGGKVDICASLICKIKEEQKEPRKVLCMGVPGTGDIKK